MSHHKYLGSQDSADDSEIDVRVAIAYTSCGALWIWSSHDIKTETKIQVYNAVMMTLLLYGAEMWTLYQCYIGHLGHIKEVHPQN